MKLSAIGRLPFSLNRTSSRVFGYSVLIAVILGLLTVCEYPIRSVYQMYFLAYAFSLIPVWIFSYSLLALFPRKIIPCVVTAVIQLLYALLGVFYIFLIRYCRDGISVELVQLISLSGVPALIRFHLSMIILGVTGLLSYVGGVTWVLTRAASRIPGPSPKRYMGGLLLAPLVYGILLYNFNPFREYSTKFRVVMYHLKPQSFVSLGVKLTGMTEQEIAASPGKNLVYIILESTEKNFLDENQFPELLPTLLKLRGEGIFFEHVYPAHNAELTFGGVYAAMTGTYLNQAHLWEADLRELTIGSKLGSLPKILHKAGYRQHFLYGHQSSFPGFYSFLSQGHYEVFRLTGAYDDSAIQQHKTACRDIALFEESWVHFQELAATGKPFNLSILTLDAHAPDGLYAPGDPVYPRNSGHIQLLNAMYASDSGLGKLIQRIKTHPAWANTCLVIQSDHLAHVYTNPQVLSRLNETGDRSLLFMICNSGRANGIHSAEGRTFDIAPTVLEAMGVKHNYIFLLGESLFAATNPARLEPAGEQIHAIQMATLFASSFDFEIVGHGIKFEETPFPVVQLGILDIPLHIANPAATETADEDACYAIRFSSELTSYDRLKHYPDVECWEASAPAGEKFIYSIVFGHCKNTGRSIAGIRLDGMLPYYCILLGPEKSLVKQAERLVELEITSGELKDFLKPAMK